MPETSPLLGGAATLSAMPLFFSPLSAPLSIECHDPTRSWVTVLCGHFSPLSAPLKTFATIPQSHSATIQTRFWVDSSVVPQSNTVLGGLFCSATIQHDPGWTLLLSPLLPAPLYARHFSAKNDKTTTTTKQTKAKTNKIKSIYNFCKTVLVIAEIDTDAYYGYFVGRIFFIFFFGCFLYF